MSPHSYDRTGERIDDDVVTELDGDEDLTPAPMPQELRDRIAAARETARGATLTNDHDENAQ
jgi:hypothetical protein